ncbi:MAG: hypothetical protein GY950_12570 [bacterium]|nr:hypothetical protein [bacterium]
MKKKGDGKGIVAIEMMVIIAVLLLATTAAIPLFLQVNPVNRENITRKKLFNIKKAVIGDPAKMDTRIRLSFGFVGDLGVPPARLVYLLENTDPLSGNPVYPTWQPQVPAGTNPLWYGWKGPYLNSGSDLVDGWGNSFFFFDSAAVDPTIPLNNDPDAITWPVIISSNGPDGDPSTTVDNITLTIEENEVRNYVTGRILTRAIPHTIVTTFTEQLEITYPNGTALAVQPVQIISGLYDSQAATLKIPIGNRYFEIRNNPYLKIASINGSGNSLVDFFDNNIPVTPTGTFFERTFYSTDDSGGNPVTPVMGTWSSDGQGNYYADGGYMEYRAVFGDPTWDDYRLEVDATLHQGRGYGIYYRSDGQANITGYCFQYDPGLTSGGRVSFVVRKVFSGTESAPFQRLDMTLAQFPDVFNASHHISITVQGNHHIIKVDGDEIFNFTDNDFLVGQPGLRSWDGNQYTDFHHLLVYDIPPLPTGETVWWSFEEGDGYDVYGSGFDIGAPEINGLLINLAHINRTWQNDNIYGQAIEMDGHASGYIAFGNEMDFTPRDAFTISLWVNIPSTAGEYTAISNTRVRGNPRNPNVRGWILRLMQESGYGFGAVFSFGARIGKARYIQVVNDLPLIPTGFQTNQWYHIAVTYDGTPYSGNTIIPPGSLRLYVTPQSAGAVTSSQQPVSSALRAAHQTAGDEFRIGSALDFSYPFNGRIDEVRIYNRALTPSEVNDVFQKHR